MEVPVTSINCQALLELEGIVVSFQTAHLNEQSAKHLVPKLLRLVTMLSIANVVLLVAVPVLVYFVVTKKVTAVGITETGRIVELVTLDKPFVSDARVIGFTEECLRLSFAHDFENYRQTMNTAKSCYTSNGARVFEDAMGPQLTEITLRSLVMSSSLDVTVIVRRYMLDGVVHWQTQTPMTLHRRGSRDSSRPVKFLVKNVIKRVPLDENVRGISVASMTLEPI
jgi:intracellular multiplication protein IcmL